MSDPQAGAVPQALEALQCAHGALLDAISEEGLDGDAGARVLGLIRAALTANGQTPPAWPDADVAMPPAPIWSAGAVPDGITALLTEWRDRAAKAGGVQHGAWSGAEAIYLVCAEELEAVAARSVVHSEEMPEAPTCPIHQSVMVSRDEHGFDWYCVPCLAAGSVVAPRVPRETPDDEETKTDTRVEPLKAGADGQDLARSGHKP